MQFQTQLRRARVTYAVLMACSTCIVMSAVSTGILTPMNDFWDHWPHVLGIDLTIAIPLTVMLGPVVRRVCGRLYPDIAR